MLVLITRIQGNKRTKGCRYASLNSSNLGRKMCEKQASPATKGRVLPHGHTGLIDVCDTSFDSERRTEIA
jgi:hypothetical protein